MKHSCGIYRIYNKVNNKSYIGQAVNMFRRCSTHRSELRGRYHPNDHFQRAWNRYGETEFVFEVLEECLPAQLVEREQFWIDYTDIILTLL